MKISTLLIAGGAVAAAGAAAYFLWPRVTQAAPVPPGSSAAQKAAACKAADVLGLVPAAPGSQVAPLAERLRAICAGAAPSPTEAFALDQLASAPKAIDLMSIIALLGGTKPTAGVGRFGGLGCWWCR